MNAKLYLLAAFVLCIVVVGFVSPVFAGQGVPAMIRFEGTITGYSEGDEIKIEKCDEDVWTPIGSDNLDVSGDYNIPPTDYFLAFGKNDIYRLSINGAEVDIRTIEEGDWTFDTLQMGIDHWSCQWNYDSNQIPEFTTISIPVAAILGLLFFFSYRKRRN